MKPVPGLLAQPIRVVLVDDQVIVREGLRFILEAQLDLQVIGDAATCQEAVTLVQVAQPDVVLLNLDLGEDNDLRCVAELRAVMPAAKIIILTNAYDLDVHHAVVTAGAMGIVRKFESGDVCARAIRRVACGEPWLDGVLMARVLNDLWNTRASSPEPTLQQRLVAEAWHPKNQPQDDCEAAKIARLTERELEVVAFIGEGLRNQQIADRLSISVITVRHHLSSLFSKLEVDDRFALAIYAYRHSLAKSPF